MMKDKKICFYTAIFSKSEKPLDKPSNFERITGIDYILFTNYNPTLFLNCGWNNIIQIPHLFDNPVLSAKTIKWKSHQFLSEYDIVIWLDSFLSPSKSKIKLLDVVFE